MAAKDSNGQSVLSENPPPRHYGITNSIREATTCPSFVIQHLLALCVVTVLWPANASLQIITHSVSKFSFSWPPIDQMAKVPE